MANCSVMSQAIYGALRIVIVRQNPSKESKKTVNIKSREGVKLPLGNLRTLYLN